MKSDFISKLAIIILGSNSSTSLANENESLIVYSLVVIGLATYHRTLLTCKWSCLLLTKLDGKLELHPPKPCEFYQAHKLSLVLNLMDISYHNFILKFHFDFLSF